MELETITMPRHEARKLFGDYAKAVREPNEKKLTVVEAQQRREDEELMACYNWLAKHDHPILNIVQALQHGGTDEQRRPRLAIARADYRHVTFCYARNYKPKDAPEAEPGQAVYYFANADAWATGAHQDKANVVVPAHTFPNAERSRWTSMRAMVPSIPAPLRPKRLADYHILWEAEWTAVPEDPYLLKRIGRWHFAVLAQWDLTPLEQGILAVSRVVR